VNVVVHVSESADPAAGDAGAGASVRAPDRLFRELSVNVWSRYERSDDATHRTLLHCPSDGCCRHASSSPVVVTLLARAMVVHAGERLLQHLPTAPSTHFYNRPHAKSASTADMHVAILLPRVLGADSKISLTVAIGLSL